MARPRVRLVVTADDFGYCPRRDEGIVEAFLAGAVTSVSLLVNGAAAESAAELARRHQIPTGLHANLSEGRPVGPARHGPSSLLSPEGFFLGKMGFREAVAAGDVALPQVREELESQLSRFRELLGRDPTHVDGHQHVHVLPGVCQVFAEALQAYRVRFTRLPMERGVGGCVWLEAPARAFASSVERDAQAAVGLFSHHGLREGWDTSLRLFWRAGHGEEEHAEATGDQRPKGLGPSRPPPLPGAQARHHPPLIRKKPTRPDSVGEHFY
nr:carbohydrate deacetylase isoform X2 [Manis javanica]